MVVLFRKLETRHWSSKKNQRLSLCEYIKLKIRKLYQLDLGSECVAGRGTPSRPESGLLSSTWKWTVWGDTWADKPRAFIGKGHLGREQEGKGTQNCSAAWLEFLGFLVMASHSDSSVLPGGTHIAQPRWMPVRGILGCGQTWWCLLLIFPELFWWVAAY